MKYLTKSELEKIQAYLQTNGLTHEEVLEDVLDHIACELEAMMESGMDFQSAFEQTQEVFSPEEVHIIQSDTLYYLTIKRTLIMIKGIFISAYMSIAIFAISFGFQYLFTSMVPNPELASTLPGLCKFVGIAIFCFAFLPLLSMYGYKRFMKQIVV